MLYLRPEASLFAGSKFFENHITIWIDAHDVKTMFLEMINI